MKKILMVILMTSIVSPTFAFANDNSERKGENSSRKSVQMVLKNEKKDIKNEYKAFKKEVRKDYKEEKKEVKKEKAKKINYFFCVTATGWNVVPVEAYKENNSSNHLGEDCVKLPGNIAKRLQAIMGTATSTATTTIDTTAPVISLLSTSGIGSTSATISWTTNEAANGNVYFSTSTPVNTITASTLANAAYSTGHSFSLTSLSPSTTYYYVVKSADVSNNVATSSQFSFTTPAIADIVAPIISGITTSGIASTTATVSWNTNELATSKVYFGLNTSTSSLPFMYNPTLSLAHSFTLTGLIASSTYNFYTESADAANNIATSTLSSFLTTL